MSAVGIAEEAVEAAPVSAPASEVARPQTGAEYLASLRDGRCVYLGGERVRDVTAHAGLRNAARSVARLYDALHPAQALGIDGPAAAAHDQRRALLTCPTDTGNGGWTHRAFRPARTREELSASAGAIGEWARMTYGWMGRTPDYKASLTNTLGACAEWYGEFAGNARRWHRLAQETAPFMCHAIVNPPVDRHLPVEKVGDVFVREVRETSAGLVVRGAKVVATSAALAQHVFIGQTGATASDDPAMALAFIVRADAPGLKMICRASYEEAASRAAGPFDAPLSSRFDENDAIMVLDEVVVPWENVLMRRDPARVRGFFAGTGFLNGFLFHGCVRFAVKLDFVAGLLARALRCTGGIEHRGNRALLGEAVGWSHTFWSLAHAMSHNPDAWSGGRVLPERRAALAYSMLAPEAWSRVRTIVQRTVASGLVYLPSSAADFTHPEVAPLLSRYVRGSGGIDAQRRVKVMKLLWDAVGSEFAGRHDLYEQLYAGGWETLRLQAASEAERSGRLAAMEALADRCMDDYDLEGWTSPAWVDAR